MIASQGLTALQYFVRRGGCISLMLMRVMPIVLGLLALLMAAVPGRSAPHELHGQQHDEDDDQNAGHETMLAVGSGTSIGVVLTRRRAPSTNPAGQRSFLG